MRYDVTKIKRARMIKGWSQSHLANLAGISPSTLSYVERGEFQKPETIRKVADCVGLEMEELLIEDSVSA